MKKFQCWEPHTYLVRISYTFSVANAFTANLKLFPLPIIKIVCTMYDFSQIKQEIYIHCRVCNCQNKSYWEHHRIYYLLPLKKNPQVAVDK